MYDFLIAASGFVVAMMAVGLFLVLRGPGNTERMMAAQLVGTGGIAALLMAGTATRAPPAAHPARARPRPPRFASLAFVQKGTPGSPPAPARVRGSEPCPRHRDDHRHLRRCVLLPRRHGRSAPLPGHAHPPPRPHESRQPGTRPGGARSAASHAGAGQRAQAGLRVAARHARQRHDLPAHCTRRAAGRAVRLTMLHALDVLVVLLVLPLAVRTIAARGPFAAVVSFMAYGLLLTLAWMRLAAPDVALAVAAIGSGLSGVLLLGAAARLRATEGPAAAERPGALLRLAAGILSATIAAGLAAGVLSLPDPGPTLAPSVAEHLATTGVGN